MESYGKDSNGREYLLDIRTGRLVPAGTCSHITTSTDPKELKAIYAEKIAERKS